RKVVLNGVAVAAVVERAELGQKVLRLRILRLVFKGVGVDGFGAAEGVDADHQRAEVLKKLGGSQGEQGGRQRYERNGSKSNLQIGVGHHGITVLLEIEPLGVLETRVATHESRNSLAARARTDEDPPAVPLKIWFARAGIFRRA